MNSNTEHPPFWSSVQAYTLSLICLVVGIFTGYLLHGPTTTAAEPTVQSQAQSPGQMALPKVTPDQLKHMADKQVEPLLAELKKTPNDAALLAKIGGSYLVARQYKTAQEYYERSVATNGKNPDVLEHLSGCYYYQGDIDKAISALQRALQVQPDHPQSLYILGVILWQEKLDAKGAIANWDKLLQTNPNYPDRAKVEQMISRAKLHLNMPPGSGTDKSGQSVNSDNKS